MSVDEQRAIFEEKLEEHLIEVVHDWIKYETWEGEDEISRAIATTNSIFDDVDIHDVEIDEWEEWRAKFSLSGTMKGYPSEEDAPWREDTIHFSIEGELLRHLDIQDEDDISDYWDVETYSVISATLESMSVDVLFLKVSTLPRNSWYRGHGDKTWELKPSIARQKQPAPSLALEEKLRLEFENRSTFLDPASHPLGIAKSNFMMQHHGLPTRLLDWSLSPLIALYFAVCDGRRDKKDGCLWVLDPQQLNKIHDDARFPYVLDKKTEKIFEEESNLALAIHAPYIDLRMKVQQAEFTLHTHYAALEDKFDAKSFLKGKIIIPSRLKPEIRKRLSNLGVTRETLFPDLDNIAKAIKDDILGEVGEDDC